MNIAFLARISDPFSPQTIATQSLGGTESSLYYLAKALAQLGHQVTVLNHCRQGAGFYDGVLYQDYDPKWGLPQTIAYARHHPIDRLILVRDFGALLFPIPADKKLFWAHDDFSPLGIYPEQPDGFRKVLGKAILKLGGKAFDGIDQIVAVSRWQAETFIQEMGIPESKIYISPNGVDTGLFEPEKFIKHPQRLIYTSCPERGLELLITRIWPLVRQACPATELQVFSYRDLWQYASIPSEGLWVRGQATKAELAQELMQAAIWVLPQLPNNSSNYNAETFCIAAAEAQCAMAVPVSSHRGALPETTLPGRTSILVPWEYPVTDQFITAFAQAIIQLLTDPAQRQRLAEAGRTRALDLFHWDHIAKKFSLMLEFL